ncbi:hypothetical protein [Chlorobaculum limnaeum]|uniref:hypothetical protein n=1 Tax=Chlorobaculum limnaeum TaxID=274537 RepID=UPI0012EE065E|nr:hypothetical protein [Chlorobaculum limnaeum]
MGTFAKKSSKSSSRSVALKSANPARSFFTPSRGAEPFFQRQSETPQTVPGATSETAPTIQASRGPKPGARVESISSGRAFGGVSRVPSDVKWRVPPSADLQAILSSGTADESVVHSRVRRLLERMHREGRLNSATSATDIGVVMDEIFPLPGQLDQAAYERYLDPTDRTMVYHSVRDAYTTPNPADRADLATAMQDAAATAQTVSTDEPGLRAVFGPTEWSTAQAGYRLINNRLVAISADIEHRISTDYNLDAQETFLGGWASFGDQHIHLLSTVVSDPLTPRSKVTLLHEAAHLADSRIDDHGYYGTPGFEAAEEAIKVNNAAHYEELPRRTWGISSYVGQTFTPGLTSSGAPLTTEEQIRAGGVQYYRKAWDAASDFDSLIKDVRRNQLDGTPLDGATVARMLEVSPLMDLTLHEQMVSPPEVTRLDITTSESIVRAMSIAKRNVPNVPNVMPMGPFLSTADEIAAGVSLAVDAAMAAYGGLLGDAARDRRLVDWLHDHYRNVYP